MTGSPFDDIICGLGGNDRLDGGDGNDVLLGGEGDDELVGGEGDDCMVGGPGSDRADNTEGRGIAREVQQSPRRIEPGPGETWTFGHDLVFDTAGRCTGEGTFSFGAGGQAAVPRVGTSSIRWRPPTAAAARRRGRVESGVRRRCAWRFPTGDSRSATTWSACPCRARPKRAGELVLLAGSQRIAHKRFTCTPPDEKVRVRLNDAGRKLVADDDRVQARLLVLAGGRTVSQQVRLVQPGG